ncbi:hypothetical protein ABT352_22730 [Streptosporangium sp. NPDC000563]|uniref:hypothetical protein n=1 Tax=Streptosporangium sp. NPDC000563 TaxID=3154366 RepID=UPI0033341755
MDLIATLSADLRTQLLAPDVAELRTQAERLHERVPHAVVVTFIAQGLAAAGDNPCLLEWKVASAREANRLLAADPDELEQLV